MTVHARSVEPPKARVLHRARNFLERGDISGESHICNHVVRSWQRCLDVGLNPLHRPENLVAESAEFGQVLVQHNILRTLAKPEMQLLFGQVSGSNYLLALGSPEGVVMDVMADTSFQDTSAGRTIINGSVWNECVRGTNAMGLALHDLAPRSVWRGEHFFRSQGGVSCIAVPILDSYGALAGVLDASTGSEDWHPHSVALLNMSVANIESGLFHHQQQQRTILRVHPRSEYLQTVSAGLLALDRNGNIVSINKRAREILGLDEFVRAISLSELFDNSEDEILCRLPNPDVFSCRSRVNGTVFLSCSHFKMRKMRPLASRHSRTVQTTAAFSSPSDEAVFADPRLMRQLTAWEKIRMSHLPILISGESGSGKSTVARHLHDQFVQGTEGGEFIQVRCSGIYDDVTLTDLVIKVKSALSVAQDGAPPRHTARTLFLEAVDELSEVAQGALLSTIDAWEDYTAQAGHRSQGPGTLIVSSCCETAQRENTTSPLRHELFFRLGAFSLAIPPLRERTDLDRIAKMLIQLEAPGKMLDPDALQTLEAHPWPGNIRELRTVVKVASSIADDATITRADILTALHLRDTPQAAVLKIPDKDLGPCDGCHGKPLRRERCTTIRQTYLDEGRNASKTARRLGVARSTVYEHIAGMSDVTSIGAH